MKRLEKVQSTVQPKNVSFDQNHVYVNSNVRVVPDEERTDLDMRKEGEEVPALYEYTVEEYEKDEFLAALSSGQIDLNDRQTMLEEAILEMSETVYA